MKIYISRFCVAEFGTIRLVRFVGQMKTIDSLKSPPILTFCYNFFYFLLFIYLERDVYLKGNSTILDLSERV